MKLSTFFLTLSACAFWLVFFILVTYISALIYSPSLELEKKSCVQQTHARIVEKKKVEKNKNLAKNAQQTHAQPENLPVKEEKMPAPAAPSKIDLVQAQKPSIQLIQNLPTIKKTASEDENFSDYLAKADEKRGRKIFRQCFMCHSAKKGASARVGPNLFGVYKRQAATQKDFPYSRAMRAYGNQGHIWEDKNLNEYLRNPQKMIRGTAMSFAGIKKAQDRADLILYLHRLKE